jgi:nitrous oxidase accessory protein NosD
MQRDSQSRVRWLAFHRCLDGNHFRGCRLGILIAAEATGDNQITDNIKVQSSVNFLPTGHTASKSGHQLSVVGN